MFPLRGLLDSFQFLLNGKILTEECIQFSALGDIHLLLADFNARTDLMFQMKMIYLLNCLKIPLLIHYGRYLCIGHNLRIINGHSGKNRGIGDFT